MARKTSLKGAWIIEFGSIDPSRDQIIAYPSRKAAVDVAFEFVKDTARENLEAYEHAEESEMLLREILELVAADKRDEAITTWLEYQGEFDPTEKIAIGPSGAVSDSPSDFR